MEGIDLDDPAIAVGFVGLFGVIEAGFELFPAVCCALGGKAVALLRRVARVFVRRGAKIIIEVFFAGKVSIPRCPAVAAVVEGAQHLRAAGVGLGLEQRSEEHTSELQSLMRISYAVLCL